jgi:DNA-binding NtrC family response regulator
MEISSGTLSESAYNLLVHGRAGTASHALREGRDVVLGRESDCTIVLRDSLVSRHHALLRVRAGSIELSDLGSRNGSFLDGARVASNVFVTVQPTAVLRIGGAVLVFEPARSSEHWCFDEPTFERKAAAIVATAKARRAAVGVVEVRWEKQDTATTSTVASSSSLPLQSLLARIVGPDGIVGAHDSSRMILVCADTDAEKLDASAALVKRLCSEHKVHAVVKTALSAEAQSVQALLQRASGSPGASTPPVIFQGGLYSLEKLISRLDASDASILIVGETGVGKDVLARSLHARSRRASRPYIALNCAAFTESLFESELFGHEKGAFTGAQASKTGLLESASGGTVFLDEIGEMPLGLQAKLLRVVENREILRVGGLQPRPIDVRFLFATNRDLRQEIENKTFRSDLFFRISSVSLKVPPLRERVDEIVPLALHFIEVAAKRIGRPVPTLMEGAAQFLKGHSWPGNVRELKNVIDLAAFVHEGDVIRPSDIHIELYIPIGTADEKSSPVSEPEVRLPPTSSRRMDADAERAAILDALERTVWNQSAAAKLLGMPRRTFVKRLAQYDLPRPRKRDP